MSARHKVAFILPNFSGGGAERVTLNLLRLIDRSRFAPRLLVLDPRGPFAEEVPKDVPVDALGIPRMSRAMPALVRRIRKLKPAVVFSTFTHINLPLLAARRCLGGPRVVAREANLPSLSLARMSWPAAYHAACRRFYPKADLMIATSNRMRDEFVQMGVPGDNIGLLYNPVDETRVRENATPVMRKPGPGVRFVAAGRLVHQKGFDRLLDTMVLMSADSHCTILGEGPERPALEEKLGRFGLAERIELPGFVANPAPFIAGADAFLLPSRFEGMPNAALEALALGVQVIATPEAGGIVEVKGVKTAATGKTFLDAVNCVEPAENRQLRNSILPSEFKMSSVAHRLSMLFDRVLCQ